MTHDESQISLNNENWTSLFIEEKDEPLKMNVLILAAGYGTRLARGIDEDTRKRVTDFLFNFEDLLC